MGRISELGYVVAEVADLAAWRRFAVDIVGLAAVDGPGDLCLGMDDRGPRLILREGPRDDVMTVGWAVRDAAALAELAAGLQAAGVPTTSGGPSAGAELGAASVLSFRDPARVPVELAVGLPRHNAPETPLAAAGFVAGDLGLGHVVLRSRDRAVSERFYMENLGFRLSDRIVCTYYGHDVDLVFLHCNPRHHSLAIGGPLPKRVHHLMVELRSLDDVGAAYDRAVAARVPLMNTLGRHPNDRMVSFYAITPSGFQVEVGWGGREVDDATWEPDSYDRISDWGHHPPAVLAPRRHKGEQG